MKAGSRRVGSAATWIPASTHGDAGGTADRSNVLKRAVLDGRGRVLLACPVAVVARAACRRVVGSTAGSPTSRRSSEAKILVVAPREGRLRIDWSAEEANSQSSELRPVDRHRNTNRRDPAGHEDGRLAPPPA